MENWQSALVVGVVLVSVGGLLMRSHVRTWDRQEHDESLSDSDRTHLDRRFRRRMNTARILFLLGILIPVGVGFVSDQLGPGLTTAFWVGVLLLTGCVIALGISDFISTATHSRAQLVRIREKRRDLEKQLQEFHTRGSGGRHRPK